MPPLPRRSFPLCLLLAAILPLFLPTVRADESAPLAIAVEKAPAPLFDDPVWHGAADPTVIWNGPRHAWMMYYTQRRATLQPVHGVDWCHGTAVGIASSPDGITWRYEGICQGDHGLSDPLGTGVSWWAPSVITDGAGTFHLYVVCVDGGIHTDWSGGATIQHFSSADGQNWAYQDTPKLSSDRCIDACNETIGGEYWMWYKDERHGSHIWAVKSPDLKDWTVVGEMAGDHVQEAPLVWRWKDRYWMATDRGSRLGIYTSADGRGHWEPNTEILGQPGIRALDNHAGKHPFMLVQGERVFVFYFVHYGPLDPVYKDRRTVIQIAELGVSPEGKLTCDRDRYR